MNARRIAVGLFLALLLCAATGARRWARYEHEMQNPADDPPDAWEKTEFAFTRLRFRSHRDGYWRGHARWGTDANKSERQFMQGLRRLSRVHVRSVEEIVDIDSDDIYNWPWIYAVGIGDWTLSPSHAARLRQYFERGGFLVVDDFHGEREWAQFMDGIQRIFPNSTVIELEDDASIFHTVFDLSMRYQVSGLQVVRGMPYERGGIHPHWRAVVDAKGRVQVGIFFNMDLGDAWEWADYPEYPEKYPALAYRLGLNYVIYAMTH